MGCKITAAKGKRSNAARHQRSQFRPRYRILRSLVSTIHPCAPTNLSHSSSLHSGGKWPSWTSIVNPAARKMEARIFFPRHRSRKKVSDSSSFGKFTSDSFFYARTVLFIIVGQFVDRLASLIAVRDHSCRDPRTGQYRSAEGNTGIN